MTGRFPFFARIALVTFLLGMGRPLHAELQYQLAARGLVGVSDNPTAQPDQGSAQALLGAEGRVGLAHVGRLSVDRLAYGIMASSWTGQAQGATLTHTLHLSSEIQPGAALQIALHGSATLTRYSMLDSVAPADPQTSGVRPAGDQRFLGLSAGQNLTWRATGTWRIAQSLEGRMFRPLGDEQEGMTRSKSATLESELARTWARDWAGLRGRLGVISSSSPAQPGPTTTVPGHSELAQVDVTWSHDWTAEFAHRVSAGVFVLWAAGQHVFPAAEARASWRGTRHALEVHAAHSAAVSMYLGTAYRRSLVGVSVGIPLDRYELLRLTAAGDAEHASSVGAGDSANILFFRCGLQWQPGDLFAFGLEYWIRRQYVSAASPDAAAFSDLHSQMVMLTAEIQYPPRGFYR